MKTIPEALRGLYAALGGEAADVQDCTTSVEVLNAIAAKFNGASDAVLNPDAIENITAIAGDIAGGDLSTAKVTISLQNMQSNPGGYMTFALPIIKDGELCLEAVVNNNAYGTGEVYSQTFDVVLYKGIYDKASFAPTDLTVAGIPTFEGGCSLSEDNSKVVITGDGTITIPVLAT